MAMIRSRENPIALQSGLLALLVHGVFFVMLVVSFSWKHVQPAAVAQVELWDSLPQPVVTPSVEVKPEPPPPPPPEIKPEPKSKSEPPPEPKAEIQVKPKLPEVKKPHKVEPKKPDPELQKKEEEKRKEDLEKLKKAMLDDAPPEHEPLPSVKETPNPADTKRASDLLASAGQPAANTDEINKYKAKIVVAIQRKVNKQLCGSGKPELVFAISLLPTGDVNGAPRLKKGSGLAACDQAVESAILAAQPLPMPPPELFSEFRDLNLRFKPNE